jgi:outer membrane receptor protein involved in Fe transport
VYRLEALGSEIQHTLRAGERHTLTAGAELRQDRADISEVTAQIDERSTLAAGYAQDVVRLAEPLTVTAGARYDRETDYGGQWSPRVGALLKIRENLEAYASWNRAYRAPALSDRYVQTEFNGLRFVGNPDLDPETLTAYEAGLRVRPTDRLRAEATVFYNDLEDSFDFLFDGDGVFRNQNVNRSHAAGVEARAEYALAERWTAFANYTYTDGEYDEFANNPGVEGNRLAYLARDKAAAGVEYAVPAGASCGLSARYVGERYGDPENRPENRMNDYVVTDLRARLPVWKGAALTLNVDNLLDRDYRDVPQYPQPGRWFMAGMEVTF